MVEAAGTVRKMEEGVGTQLVEQGLEGEDEGGAVEGAMVDARVVNEEAETSMVETTETWAEEERRPPISQSLLAPLSSPPERQERR